ncbi:MAG TPA: DinB family protein [Candidatus Krumholzibacteria bacterium]|nr:DinB family protein [Candidatus Krumholzibacteria bacterium]
MTLGEYLVGEFDHEAQSTRRVLDRVPEAHVAWAPHSKSRSLGELANHIAGLPVWVGRVLQTPEYDFLAPGNPTPGVRPWESKAALMAKFDKNVAEARAIMKATSDEKLLESWSLKRGGEVVYTLPRLAAVRSMVLSHTIHHRGQLTVYLRLKDVPVPGVYGPSADEM